jgi:hypothetical protein
LAPKLFDCFLKFLNCLNMNLSTLTCNPIKRSYRLVNFFMPKLLLFLLAFLFTSAFVFSQNPFVSTAPSQDGSISAAEYGNCNSGPWYMAWDNTNLYVAKTGGATGEPTIMYFSFTPNTSANGGVASGTAGQTTGKNDYNVTPNLPFAANARVFWTSTYAEVTINTGSGWGSAITTGLIFNTGSTNKEIKIPWSVLNNGGGIPAAFDWLGTASSTGNPGFIYDALPTVNYSGSSSGTPTYYYYQTVDATASGAAINPFNGSRISYTNYNTSSYNYTSSLPATLFDFTLGGNTNSGTTNLQSSIIIGRDLVVKDGTLDVTNGTAEKISMTNAAGNIFVFTASGGNIYGTDNEPSNDLTLQINTGAFITFGGDAGTTNSDDHKFHDITVQTGATLALGRGILARYGSFSVAGTLQVNLHGYVEGGATSAAEVSYSSGSLVYSVGGPYLATDFEWPTTNAPANVAIQTSGTTVTLNDSKTIAGILTLSSGTASAAPVVTSTNTVTMGAAGSISGASSLNYINGNLGWAFNSAASHIFPIGNGNNNYHPVTFNYTSLTGSSTVTIADIESALSTTIPASARLFSSRYWTVTQSGASTYNYNISLDPTGFTPLGTAVILKSDNSAVASSNAATTPNYTNSSAFTSIGSTNSNFALAQTNIPLTITGVTANNKTYDGGNTAILNTTSAALSGIINPDVVTLISTGASATFASSTVANNIAVTASGFTLGGANAAEYSLSQPSGLIANITKAALTITANNQSKCIGSTFNFTGTEFTTVPSSLYGTDAITGLSITSSGSVSSATVAGSPYSIIPNSATGTGLGNYTITYTNGAMTVNPDNYIGGNGGDWSAGGSWSCGVPGVNADVTVASGAPILSAPVVVNNLAFNGTTLSLNGQSLTINGALTGTGTLTGSSTSNLTIGGTAGTLNFTGSSTLLNTLSIGAGGSASLGSALSIVSTGSLDIANGGSLATNNLLTLKSDENGTASVGTNTSGSTYITGNVTVERYIPANSQRAWRLLSVPTQTTQTINQSWQEGYSHDALGITGYGTIITAGTPDAAWSTNGFDTIQVAASMLSYNQAGGSWSAVTTTNGASGSNPTAGKIATTSGYFMYIRGDRTQLPASTASGTTATVLRTSGPLYQGTQTPISIPTGQYGLIGNTYASAIDFTGITKDAGIDDKFYVWDPKLLDAPPSLGAYVTFSSVNSWIPVPGSAGTGSYGNTANSLIQSGQAFFVHASSTGNVTLNENSKVSGSAMVFRPAGTLSTSGRLTTNLYKNGTTLADGNVEVFNTAYSDAVDGNDALKLSNTAENFGILRDGQVLVIEARQPVITTDTIYYEMWNMQQQQYKLEFTPESLNTNLTAYLEDAYLGTQTPISISSVTDITFNIDSNPASSDSFRFSVVLSASTPVPVTFTGINAKQQSNGSVTVSWKVASATGIKQYSVQYSTDGTNFNTIGTVAAKGNGPASYSFTNASATTGVNYYRVEGIGEAGDITYSSIANLLAGTSSASGIKVYPNPVTGNQINVQFNNLMAGVYTARLLNTDGQEISIATINYGGSDNPQAINIPSTLAAGSYKLEVSMTGKTVYTSSVIIE